MSDLADRLMYMFRLASDGGSVRVYENEGVVCIEVDNPYNIANAEEPLYERVMIRDMQA